MKRLLVLLILCAPCFATTWPGQVGNSVGYQAYGSGTLNATACGAQSSGSSWATAVTISSCTYSTTSHTTISCNWCIFSQVDFKSSATADNNVLISGQHILFIGSRFQSNCIQCGNVSVTSTATDVYFLYDSFTPLASFYTSPPGSTWPSAGAGSNSTTITDNVNAVAVNQGYQIGIYANTSTGTIYVDHCDIWGFGNAILWGSTTTQQTITGNWIHDPAQPAGVTGGNYHTDYITYANGATGPNNINVNGNTLAGLGNTNVIAWQNQTGGTGFYNNIYNDFNYISGDNATVAFCRNGCVNSHFYGNTLGTDIMNSGNIDTGATIGTGTVWACNKINFATGTTWTNLDGWTPTSAMNGQFMLDTSLSNSATDQGSNIICGIPSPSSINFGNQGVSSSSAGTTITFSNTNSGTLSSISASLATGTQFSISANTCGATLAASSSCSITVKFTPTGYGPQTDTLQIADNSSGVSSPQLVPLIGVGVTNTGVPVSNSSFMGVIR